MNTFKKHIESLIEYRLWLNKIPEDHVYELTWPRVHKAFQNQDQDQAQVKKSFTMDFLWNLL